MGYLRRPVDLSQQIKHIKENIKQMSWIQVGDKDDTVFIQGEENSDIWVQIGKEELKPSHLNLDSMSSFHQTSENTCIIHCIPPRCMVCALIAQATVMRRVMC